MVGPFGGVLDATAVETRSVIAFMLASSLPPIPHQLHAGEWKLVGVEGIKNAYDASACSL